MRHCLSELWALASTPKTSEKHVSKTGGTNFHLCTVPSPCAQGHSAALLLSSPPLPCSTGVTELGYHPPLIMPQGKWLQHNRSWALLSAHIELLAQLPRKMPSHKIPSAATMYYLETAPLPPPVLKLQSGNFFIRKYITGNLKSIKRRVAKAKEGRDLWLF